MRTCSMEKDLIEEFIEEEKKKEFQEYVKLIEEQHLVKSYKD